MSGEQKIPRPATLLASSHTRPAEPFLPADDIEDVPPEEVREVHDTESPLAPLQQLRKDFLTAVAGLHRRLDREFDGTPERDGIQGIRPAINALAVRVAKVEADAQWKRWAISVGKVIVTAGAGAIAAKYPELAQVLAPLLTGAP